MGQPSVPPDSLTLGTSLWLFVGLFFSLALVVLVSGWVVRRRTTLGRAHARQILYHLLKWGVVRAHDLPPALARQNLVAAALINPRSGWISLEETAGDRILRRMPHLLPLLVAWEQSSAEGFIGAGYGALITSALSAGLVLLAQREIDLADGLANALPFAFLLAVISSLFLVGLFGGWGMGLLKGVFKQAMPREDRALLPDPAPRHMEEYRSPKLSLLAWMLVLLSVTNGLSALLAASSASWGLVGWLTITPVLMVVSILLYDRLMRSLASLPPVRLTTIPVLAERADQCMVPRLLQSLLGLEYGTIGGLLFFQFPFLLGLASREDLTFHILICVVGAAVCGVFAALVNAAYGRLGGRRTGWPWSQRTGTPTLDRENSGAVPAEEQKHGEPTRQAHSSREK